jgi:hypothetical protein
VRNSAFSLWPALARQLLKGILKSLCQQRFSDASAVSRGVNATEAGKLKRKHSIRFDTAAPGNATNFRQASAKSGARGKENAMTRRALRIATIIVIIQSLLFFPAPVSRAQDGPTQAELALAQETANLFMKRLDETGDFSTVIDEMYAEDFIERYLEQQIRESEGLNLNSCSTIEFSLGLDYKRSLLKQATIEDWKRLYIAVNNFTYHFIVAGLNYHADDLLNDRELDDETAVKHVPSKVIALLNKHPILKGYLGLDDRKPVESAPDEGTQSGAAEEESGPKSIETPEEMQDVAETLQEAVRLLLEEQGDHSPKMTEAAKSALEIIRLGLKDEGMMEPEIKIEYKKYLGLPAGTRILIAPTPISCWLEIAQVNGKQKIVQAQFIFGD